MLYLKIENPGICPLEGFTVLGVSTSRYSNKSGVIGCFGSGNKHSVSVCLRHSLNPVVFCGSLKLEFFTKPQNINDGIDEREFQRVCVKYSGKDPETKKSKTSTEDLGFVLEYGTQDWTDISMALREFISNAIDRSLRETDSFTSVKIEIVSEEKVRAKEGFTRVFIPVIPAVQEFYVNLGKWFLHFSEPELLDQTILPKKRRNLSNTHRAVIYRKGVRVREFENSNMDSLFDYNLNTLTVDEARKVDDWKVKHEAGKVLAKSPDSILAEMFLNTGKEFWEFTFDSYALEPNYGESEEVLAKKSKAWQSAFENTKGENAVLVSQNDQAEMVKRKGFVPVVVSESLVKAAKSYGVPTAEKILNSDDMEGREIVDTTSSAKAAVELIWDVATKFELTKGKSKPEVKCFRRLMAKGEILEGYYKDGVVYFNVENAPDGISDWKLLSERLLIVAIEEVGHYVSGATDFSRDFQDWIITLSMKVSKAYLGI